jgi:transposase
MVLEHGADHASQWGSDWLDCGEDWLHRGDVAWLRASGGARPGTAGWPTSDDRGRIKALEREVRELRQANEILRKASAYFAMAELDRRSKP